MRFQTKVIRRFRRLQAEQASADDRSSLDRRPVGKNSLQVLNLAIHEDTLVIDAWNFRDEGIGAGGNHGKIIGDLPPLVGMHHLGLTIDPIGAIADMQFHAVGFVPFRLGQQQLFGIPVDKKRGQTHAVIGRSRFFAKRHDPILPGGIVLDQFFAKPLSHHPVADHDNVLTRMWIGLSFLHDALSRQGD
jgi:hypothetical protein